MPKSFYKYLPLIVFTLIWGLVLGLYSLKLYNIRTVDQSTLVILSLSLLSFILGYILFTLYDLRTLRQAQTTIEDLVDINTLCYIVLLLTLFLAGGTLLVLQTMSDLFGGLDVYTNNPLKVRYQIIDFQVNPLTPPPLIYRLGNYLINFGFVGVLFGGTLFAMRGPKRWLGLVPVFMLLITSIVFLGRYLAFSAGAFFFISYLISTYFMEDNFRKKRFRELVVYSSVFLGLLGFLSFIIIQSRGVGRLGNISEYLYKTGYLYVTGGIPAFDNFLNQDFNYVYGQSSLRSLFKWFAKFGFWPEEKLFVIHEPFTKVTPSVEINTYTYIKSFYEDFGITGILFGSLIFAGLCKLFVFRALSSFSFIWITIAVTFIFGVLMSFYSFYFHSVSTIIYRVLAVVIIHYFAGSRLYKNYKVMPKNTPDVSY